MTETSETTGTLTESAAPPAEDLETVAFPATRVYPGQAAQAFIPNFSGGTVHGFDTPPHVQVIHLLAGEASLRPKEGESWSDLLGVGLSLPHGFVTISMISTDELPHDADVLMLVSNRPAPPAPTPEGPKKTFVTTTNGRRVATSNPKSPTVRVRGWTATRRIRGVAASGPRPSKIDPELKLDLMLSLLQRQQVVDLLERGATVPLPMIPAIVHAFMQAPTPADPPRPNAVLVAHKHLAAVVSHLQTKAPIPLESTRAVLDALHHEHPNAHRPRIMSLDEAKRVSDARREGIITVEAESVRIESVRDVSAAAPPRALPEHTAPADDGEDEEG